MTAVYNEHDPRAAAWLRQLIAAKAIEDGSVIETDIRQLSPTDLQGFRRVHLFAGIGGWDYALQLAGWPADQPVWTGSCPCQPYSTAGRGEGDDDPRNLWPEFRRLLTVGKPAVVFGEQVASKAGREWLAGVRTDLEALGYAVGAADLCAASKNAPHIRQRLFWVGVTEGGARRLSEWQGRQVSNNQRAGEACRLADTEDEGRQRREQPGVPEKETQQRPRLQRPAGHSTAGRLAHRIDARWQGRLLRGPNSQRKTIDRYAGCNRTAGPWDAFEIVHCADGKTRRFEPGSFPLADGLPGRVGLLRGYGNAIVPQIAAEFIAAFIEALSERQD